MSGGQGTGGHLISARDVAALRFVGEQYVVPRALLAVVLGRLSDAEGPRTAGRVSDTVVDRALRRWRSLGLVGTSRLLVGESSVWATTAGLRLAGLPYRGAPPSFATVTHRHAVAQVRLEAESRKGLTWICERELRESLPGRRDHLPDGVVTSTDGEGRRWRTAIEVELTAKTQARVAEILRLLLAEYDDVVYFARPGPAEVVSRAVAGQGMGERVRVRPYPPVRLARPA